MVVIGNSSILISSCNKSCLTWDLSNGDEIVVENLVTYGEPTDGKEQLTALAQQVCDSYKTYRDWETDRKSTRLNSSHITRSRMPSSA